MAAELNFASLAQGPTLRPAQSADAPFIDKVYRSARPDLQWIQGSAN